MLELLGLGAILLDGDGNILFASDRARDAVQGAISVSGRRLAAVSAGARAWLERIGPETADGKPGGETILSAGGASAPFGLRALHLADSANPAAQLLKTILVVRKIVS